MISQQSARRARLRVVAGLFSFLMIGMISSTGLRAQWEQTFGGAVCDEVANKGVAQVNFSPGGGYIVAGTSFSVGAACANNDVYVTRISDVPAAAPLWSNTYHIGGAGSNSGARCIAECANGDFIVTGVAQNLGGCHQNDLFLIRLTPAGGVVWARTYGMAGVEAGTCVIEATTGDGITTNPGDIVACGLAINAAGVTCGYLLRTSSAGALIWDETYGMPPGNLQLRALTESHSGIPAPGDIIAVGSVITAVGLDQNFILRVSGNTGLIGAPPQNAVWFGSPAVDGLDDVQELHVGANFGNIVASGISNGEAYLVKTGADPCGGIIAQIRFGDGGAANPDEAYGVRELTSGNLLVTGESSVPGGHGGLDGFLAEFTPGPLALVPSPPGVSYKVYGGAGPDGMHSCSQVTATAGHPGGYIAAGYTQSAGLIPPGDVGQLYVVKTSFLGATSCDIALAPVVAPSFWGPVCAAPAIVPITTVCIPPCIPAARPWKTLNCVIGPTNHENGGGGNDGIASADPESTTVPGESSVTSYPNPVAKGQTITFNYALAKGADVTITISDIKGAIVARSVVHCDAGTNRIPVSTDGWASGTYMVKFGASGGSVSRKVIVTDR